ncbi:glycosyltransferase family 2 protein [Sedimentitalea todarodis]|uniref:Glycosyltransferase family 2 protein n=1 Tax=Sedimentitalea todarodis TaxID=1631240 RepID=A0ABU3VGF4_9RHOB|nr:glycosyltransferase family 2 protein [Sedimentitalea todarodis]MDU9005173.1 glycosyltransferase family 2 protein [Sedimentitalea todarodis]
MLQQPLRPPNHTHRVSKPATTTIAVVIVNFGAAELTMAAIESVLTRVHGGRQVELHVVDNASPGDDAAVLAARHAQRGWGDRVKLWLEDTNLGFGRGNNVVLDYLGGRADPPDYVFFLNPDAELENEALAILSDRLDATPTAAVAGAAVTLPTGQPVTAAFRFPSARSEFAQAANFGPVTRLFRGDLVPLPPNHPEGQVDWVVGAAMLVRFQVLRDMCGFDPDFFLYYEEVELMWRIRQHGHDVLYVPAALVRHAEGMCTNIKSDQPVRERRPAYWYDSWRLYYLKTSGRGGAIRAGLCWMAGAALNVPLAALRGQHQQMPKLFFRDFSRLVMKPLFLGPGTR